MKPNKDLSKEDTEVMNIDDLFFEEETKIMSEKEIKAIKLLPENPNYAKKSSVDYGLKKATTDYFKKKRGEK